MSLKWDKWDVKSEVLYLIGDGFLQLWLIIVGPRTKPFSIGPIFNLNGFHGGCLTSVRI